MITFTKTSTVHKFEYSRSTKRYAIKPALEDVGALYILENPTNTHRPYYIGTAANVRKRFLARTGVLRELGMPLAAVEKVNIHIVFITIDGVSAPPNSNGIINGEVDDIEEQEEEEQAMEDEFDNEQVIEQENGEIDGEKLLMRTYTHYYGKHLQNMSKANIAFKNATGSAFQWELIGDFPGRTHDDWFEIEVNGQL
jgi:hypothetical protein